MDTLEPLQEFLNSKLPPVPEEEDIFRSGALNSNYSDLDLMTPMTQQINETSVNTDQQQASVRQDSSNDMQNLQYTAKIYAQPQDSTVYRSNAGISDNYITARQNYEIPIIREKNTRSGRSTTRGNRVIQQTSFNQSPQHQIVSYQPPRQSTYNPLDLQSVQLNSTTTQVTMNSLTNAAATNPNQLTTIENHVHNLVAQSNFSQSNTTQDSQSRSLQLTDPFKIVQSQAYKLPTNQTFNASPQQYKFRPTNLKNVTAQPVTVTVSSSPPTQSHILLQCKPSGLDLTAPALHPTKLLPRPSNVSSTEKEEVFAVPKYQMKARSRSRSSSAMSSRNHPPPLVSAVSDPTLNLNSNVLLAQLLTNNTSGLYTVTSGPDKLTPSTSGVKNILPMLPSTSAVQVSNHITTPITIQTLHNTAQGQGSSQVMLNATSMNQQQAQSNSPGSPKDTTTAHSPQALSLSPLHSPMSVGSPMSPSRGFIKGEPERGKYNEQRRVGHIHAEQKRRYNIKNGFDMLHSLIPQLNRNSNTKISKAALLQKGADYIRQLRLERNLLKEEMDSLKHQIECLNTSIRYLYFFLIQLR